MDDIFIFEDIVGLQSQLIKNILMKVSINDLTKALICEDEKIRKLFYRNMSLDDLENLDVKLKTTNAFTRYDKNMAQKKILDIIAEMPKYQDTRFGNGFYDMEKFGKYLTERREPENKYGMFDADITMCRFFESKDGDKILEEIRLKNETEDMGNIIIPNTNIQLINYSVCPKCNRVFSFKDISDYYLNPKPNLALFKNIRRQYREDTRVCCNECETYFLPSIVIVDGTPKNEVQFLCRIQTMQAIEIFYQKKGIKVLSRKEKNIVKINDEKHKTKTAQDTNNSFIKRLFNKNISDKKNTKKIIIGIRNDVLLKEMEEKPTLISNLIQYTPSNIVLNLIEGSNIKKGDLLFGNLQ